MAGSARTFNDNVHNLAEVARTLKFLKLQIPLSSYDWTGAAPGLTDDITKGYKVGSIVITGTQAPPNPSHKVFICSKNDEGAAVWQENMGTSDVAGSGGIASAPDLNGSVDYVGVGDVSAGTIVRVILNQLTAAIGAQPLDAFLTSIADFTGTAADKIIYTTAADTAAETGLSAFIRTFLDDVDAATARETLGAGDVVGPASATDLAICIFDGTTGKIIKVALVTIDASGNILLPSSQEMRFRDANTAIWSSASTVLRIKATGNIRILTSDLYFDDPTAVHRYFSVRDVVDAVNYAEIKPSATGNPVLLTILGTDANRSFNVVTAGTGRLQENGANIPKLADPLSQFAATTSAQLAGVISDETGSGALVFATSPTLVTPALGTPSALVLTNATALPAAQIAAGTLAAKVNLGEGADPATIGLELDNSMSADERYSGITIPGTAGATLAFGDLCYLDVTATEWLLADADATATSGGVVLGICVDASTDGAATSMLLLGTVRSAAFPASIALGAPLYVSTTAGDISAAQPSGVDDVIRVVGFAVTVEPNTIYFNPSSDYITHV